MKRYPNYFSPLMTTDLVIATILIAIFLFLARSDRPASNRREQMKHFLAQEYRKAPVSNPDLQKGSKPFDQPGAAAFQEYLMTLDPATGKVPRERLPEAYKKTRIAMAMKSDRSINWQGTEVEMGGRTRMIMYDPNDPDHRKVWAGGVTGGLWYNENITSIISPWIPAGDFWPVLSIRCMAYDPNNTQVFYIGTGEPETALITYRESSGVGQGIWKSIDGGQTWSQIPSTQDFVFITDILVRNEGGNSIIYAGVVSGIYHGEHTSIPTDGLYRSSDGGITWNQVLPDIIGSDVPYAPSDIDEGPDGRIYVGSRPNLNDEGGATLLFSDSGLAGTWTVNEDYMIQIQNDPYFSIPGRVVLAASKSNLHVVYALIGSGYINPTNNFKYFYCYHILRSDDKGVTWTERPLPTDLTSGNNFATISWHALDIAIDPNNENHVYIGGLDCHHSGNGGVSWSRVSDWSLMYSSGGSQYIHADQHIIVFKPGSSNEILFGTDGGVFYTANGTATLPTFEQHNYNYNTLQFYTCAINPNPGSENYLGGLQDNGTLYYSGFPLTIDDMVQGGDGAYCFYDENDASLTITSIYYNQYKVYINGGAVNYLYDWSCGTFISPAAFDYQKNAIYANAVNYIGGLSGKILRITNITANSNGVFLDMNTGDNVCFTAVTYSPHSPANQTNLMIGNQLGRVFKVEHAESVPMITEIGDPNFPPGNVSSIAIGGSEDTLLVVFSNYGVPSVWLTTNGGQTWTDKEGNLPDMPVRWALFHPDQASHCMLATETGIWITTNVHENPVIWEPAVDGMANVRVDMLRLRKADNTVLAASHGRGLFTTIWDIATGTREISKQDLVIYPNPASAEVHFMYPFPESDCLTILLIDCRGRTVMSQEMQVTSEFHGKVDVSGNSKGSYILVLKVAGKQVASEKLLIL